MRNLVFGSGLIGRIVLFVGLLMLVGSGAVCAQTYPARPVTIVVPFAAGTVTDVNARQLAQYLQARLNQTFVVDNRPGAGGYHWRGGCC